MRHIEDALQKSCVNWFSYQYVEYAKLLHHSPNGGKRNAIEAAKFKAMGVRAGFPDLILCIARHGYHGLFVELKTATGKQSEKQKYYQYVLEEQGYKYVVIRTLEDFINVINDYLNDYSTNDRGSI